MLLIEEDSKQWLTKQNTIERRKKTMQIKITPMKNQRSERPNSSRDHFRSAGKVKTLTRKRGRKAKQFVRNAA